MTGFVVQGHISFLMILNWGETERKVSYISWHNWQFPLIRPEVSHLSLWRHDYDYPADAAVHARSPKFLWEQCKWEVAEIREIDAVLVIDLRFRSVETLVLIALEVWFHFAEVVERTEGIWTVQNICYIVITQKCTHFTSEWQSNQLIKTSQ